MPGERSPYPLAATAAWTAAARASESKRDDPLVVDPFAEELAGQGGEEIRASVDALPGPCSADTYVAIRTRFYDEFLQDAARRGIDQLALLGAGLDARAYRLPWPDGVTVFEVDAPQVLERKDCILAGMDAVPLCDRRVVTADLGGDWPSKITAAGLAADRPVAWLIEGVLPYLDPHEAGRLVEAATRLAAPDSRLGADLPNAEYLTHPWTEPFREEMARHGTPFRFGLDDPQPFFAQAGWEAAIHQPGEPGVSAARWPFPVSDPSVRGFPRSFLVTADRV